MGISGHHLDFYVFLVVEALRPWLKQRKKIVF